MDVIHNCAAKYPHLLVFLHSGSLIFVNNNLD